MRFIKSITFIVLFITLGLSNSFDVLYDSDADIGGFQFNVTGIEDLSLASNAASGGAAASAGAARHLVVFVPVLLHVARRRRAAAALRRPPPLPRSDARESSLQAIRHGVSPIRY